MPMRLIDPNVGVPWIHPDDFEQIEIGEELHRVAKTGSTTFHIIPLTEGQSRRLLAAHQTIKDSGTPQIDIDKFLGELYLKNITKIENVLWPGSTVPVTITTEADRLRFLECVPAGFMGAMYQAIQNISKLDEGEVKNSDGSSALPT